jgi:hypothetical protein
MVAKFDHIIYPNVSNVKNGKECVYIIRGETSGITDVLLQVPSKGCQQPPQTRAWS